MAGKRRSGSEGALKLAGRRLWDSVLADFELDEHERSLLLQTCQTLDIIDDLQQTITTLGVDVAARELTEIRQQRLAYARLLAALRLPSGSVGDEAKDRRPQRRTGARGVYQIGGA